MSKVTIVCQLPAAMIDRQTIDRRLAAIRNPDHILVCGDWRPLDAGPSLYI